MPSYKATELDQSLKESTYADTLDDAQYEKSRSIVMQGTTSKKGQKIIRAGNFDLSNFFALNKWIFHPLAL
jgi:hypothetical protein